MTRNQIPRCLLMLAALAALVVVPAARAQTAEDAIRFTDRFPATGARMIGLGGAGIGGFADPSAFFMNPAGLGYYRKSEFSGALNSFYVTDEAFVSAFDNTLDNDASTTQLGNLAYIYRAPTRQGALVFGVGFNQVNTFERDLRFGGLNAQSTITTGFLPFSDEYSIDDDGEVTFFDDFVNAAFQAGAIEYFPEFLDEDPDAYPFLEAVAPGTTIEQNGTVIEEGRMSELNFGGAWEAARGVMVGLSANLAFGEYNFLSIFEEIDVRNENGPEDYAVFGPDGDLLEGFDFFEFRQNLESDLVGINLRGGVSGEVADNVRVGVTLETPTLYSISEQFSTRLETVFDQGGSLVYGDNFDDDFGNGEFEYEITTPWRLGVGVVFDAENVTVMADAEVIDWSQLELDAEFDREYFFDLNQQIQQDYEAVVNTRFGVEYRLDALALRAGFAYQPDPLDDRTAEEDGLDLDHAKTFFSLGVGYQFSDQFFLDFGWMQTRFDDVYAAYPAERLAINDPQLFVDEEVVRNRFAVGLRFQF